MQIATTTKLAILHEKKIDFETKTKNKKPNQIVYSTVDYTIYYSIVKKILYYK